MSQQIRFGLVPFTQATSWDDLIAVCRQAEAVGYDSLWLDDHLLADYGDDDQDKYEVWTTLAAVATMTSSITLGHLISPIGFREPAVTAKLALCVDQISHGRLTLGLGAGNFEREHTSFGLPFGPLKERQDRLDEGLGVIRQLLEGKRVTHHGTYYDIEDLQLAPGPSQQRIPLLVGGMGEKRGLRIVARHGDAMNFMCTAEESRSKLAALAEHAVAEGREPSAIESTLQGPMVIIRDDPAAAQSVLRAAHEHNQKPMSDATPLEWLGSPSAVAAMLAPYVDLGFSHFMFLLLAPYDQETLHRLVSDVRPLVQAHADAAVHSSGR